MIAKGLITKRANKDLMPAQTVERDYILAQLCADIGTGRDARLVFKGGTLLRLCYFEDYRYSADLDFSAVDGLSSADAIGAIQHAAAACRARIELPLLEIVDTDGTTAWVNYVGPLGSKPRTIKLDVSQIWHLYLRKAANDVVRGKQRTPPSRWAETLERRLSTYAQRWETELSDYLGDVPRFDDVRRQTLRELGPLIEAARSLADDGGGGGR